MAVQQNSNAFWWALIGFFLGVAATLGGIIWIGGTDVGADGAVAGPKAAAALESPAPMRRALKPPRAAQAGEDAPISDEQVAEDAAAAGMTSRARTPADSPQ